MSASRPSRYLSPEPLLHSPAYVRLLAQSGMSVPTYAYAANNPLRYTDSAGLFFDVPCPAGVDCNDLGNFQPPPPEGPPAPQFPYDPYALPPPKGGSPGSPVPLGPTDYEKYCKEKCDAESKGAQLQIDYCRRNRPQDLIKCLECVADGVRGCFAKCMHGNTKRGPGELTCR